MALSNSLFIEKSYNTDNNILSITWKIDSRIWNSTDIKKISPEFNHPNYKESIFILILVPVSISDKRGLSSFKSSKKKGIVLLKCIRNDNLKLSYRVSIENFQKNIDWNFNDSSIASFTEKINFESVSKLKNFTIKLEILSIESIQINLSQVGLNDIPIPTILSKPPGFESNNDKLDIFSSLLPKPPGLELILVPPIYFELDNDNSFKPIFTLDMNDVNILAKMFFNSIFLLISSIDTDNNSIVLLKDKFPNIPRNTIQASLCIEVLFKNNTWIIFPIHTATDILILSDDNEWIYMSHNDIIFKSGYAFVSIKKSCTLIAINNNSIEELSIISLINENIQPIAYIGECNIKLIITIENWNQSIHFSTFLRKHIIKLGLKITSISNGINVNEAIIFIDNTLLQELPNDLNFLYNYVYGYLINILKTTETIKLILELGKNAKFQLNLQAFEFVPKIKNIEYNLYVIEFNRGNFISELRNNKIIKKLQNKLNLTLDIEVWQTLTQFLDNLLKKELSFPHYLFEKSKTFRSAYLWLPLNKENEMNEWLNKIFINKFRYLAQKKTNLNLFRLKQVYIVKKPSNPSLDLKGLVYLSKSNNNLFKKENYEEKWNNEVYGIIENDKLLVEKKDYLPFFFNEEKVLISRTSSFDKLPIIPITNIPNAFISAEENKPNCHSNNIPNGVRNIWISHPLGYMNDISSLELQDTLVVSIDKKSSLSKFIFPGDRILKVCHFDVKTKEELIEKLEKYSHGLMNLIICHDHKKLSSEDNYLLPNYKIVIIKCNYGDFKDNKKNWDNLALFLDSEDRLKKEGIYKNKLRLPGLQGIINIKPTHLISEALIEYDTFYIDDPNIIKEKIKQEISNVFGPNRSLGCIKCLEYNPIQ